MRRVTATDVLTPVTPHAAEKNVRVSHPAPSEGSSEPVTISLQRRAGVQAVEEKKITPSPADGGSADSLMAHLTADLLDQPGQALDAAGALSAERVRELLK